MLKNWFGKLKQKEKNKKQAEEEELKQIESDVENKIEQDNQRMMKKWCPTVNGLCKGENCIHFKSAYYFYADDEIFNGIYGRSAKCRLWGDY